MCMFVFNSTQVAKSKKNVNFTFLMAQCYNTFITRDPLLHKTIVSHPTNNIIFCQIAALTPVAEAAKTFTKDYTSFATAVDTTRHELPVKNFYIDGDRREFLGS